jgi:gamma-glutamyltranspeptidase / glutathione hydrolase
MSMNAHRAPIVTLVIVIASTLLATAQSPIQPCSVKPQPAWCSAVEGDRSEGWLSQHRSEVMGRNGMVAASQPLAAQAGLDILKRGGNAIDAAVATSAVLSLVEPMNVGLGGDLFAIVYIAKDNKLYALNASGKAPSGQTLAHMNELGYAWNPANWGPGSGMPPAGILSATVPGSVWGWDEVLHRFGTMTFKETLQSAIDYADNGFPVSERIANDWRLPRGLPPAPNDPRQCCSQLDPDSVATWYVNGQQPRAGQLYRSPEMATTFRILQAKGRDGFYKGDVARAIVTKSQKLGGTMTEDDLATYSGEWLNVATTTYHGYDVSTLPPPAQTWAADEMLNVLEACVPVWAPGQTLATLGPTSPKYWHFLVEAKKLAYTDLLAYNGDPNFVPVPLAKLLSKPYAQSLCSRVDPDHASQGRPGANISGAGDTIVLSTADRWGNMVSWVNSNYGGFGSGITVPGYGFVLHNRGALFTLDPKSPNVIAPHKRPFNTLSAGFVMHNNRPLMTVTLMGGDMQAQGIAQVLINVLDLGANLQAATDMARFHHSQVPNALTLESKLFGLVGKELLAMGHKAQATNGGAMGGYQAIMFTPDGDARAPTTNGQIGGFYRGGSDHRKDGQVVAY